MKIAPFETEQFFAKYEFSAPYQLCNSDCETLSVEELLNLADVPLQEFSQLSLGYTESLGNPLLREMIAETYPRVNLEDVIMLATPVEGIYLVARAVLDPGDEVIVMSPAYDALTNTFEHVVGTDNVKKWMVLPGGKHWFLDIDHLRKLITSRTKLLVVNFPHNPTGFLPSLDQLKEIGRIVEENGLILFCDEMYFGLVHSGTEPIPSASQITRRAVVLSGLSKTYGLPGLRTGWLVIPDEELRENIINWKFYTSICAPAPSEFLAMAAWKVRDQLRLKNISLVEHNIHLAEALFENWPDLFTWRKPMAGSVALVGMHVPSVRNYAARMAEEAGILILPGVNLGSDDHHFRMGFGRTSFPEALKRFEAYLSA